MSEENTDILDDGDIAYLSPAEAQGHIDKILADKQGPYWQGVGRDHRLAVERVAKLYQVVSPDEPQTNADGEVLVEQWPPAMVRAMEKGLQEQAEKRQKILAQAQSDMDFLVEHGFERSNVPVDITDWEVSLLHCERLNAEKPTPARLQEISQILEREALKVPDPDIRAAISALSTARLSLNRLGPDEFREIAEKAIHLILDAHEDRRSAKGKTTKSRKGKR